jgi:hypothetical protein
MIGFVDVRFDQRVKKAGERMNHGYIPDYTITEGPRLR